MELFGREKLVQEITLQDLGADAREKPCERGFFKHFLCKIEQVGLFFSVMGR
jgi:hypothetical protein